MSFVFTVQCAYVIPAHLRKKMIEEVDVKIIYELYFVSKVTNWFILIEVDFDVIGLII